jgi:hypothetical protein
MDRGSRPSPRDTGSRRIWCGNKQGLSRLLLLEVVCGWTVPIFYIKLAQDWLSLASR